MEGGIRIPRVPALVMTPAAKLSGYPALTMPTMTIEPIAATVAGEDPETAAKIMHAMTEAMAIPPLICPTRERAKRIIRLATPPVERKAEERMKKGMASRV